MRPNEVSQALDKLGVSDACIAKIFGVSRQAVMSWRRDNSVPKHFARVFENVTGLTLEQQAEIAESKRGLKFLPFVDKVRKELKEAQLQD